MKQIVNIPGRTVYYDPKQRELTVVAKNNKIAKVYHQVGEHEVNQLVTSVNFEGTLLISIVIKKTAHTIFGYNQSRS